MSVNKHNVGIGNVGSYQVSGHPFVTGSASIDAGIQHKIEFPRISKAITVINSSAVTLLVHFTDKDQGNTVSGLHYLTLPGLKDQITLSAKCKEIYVTSLGGGGSYQMYAELTGIETKEMYPLTGSGLTE